MYGKIFSQIYDGTLGQNWKALVTFQQMIVLCDADGVLDMTPQAMSARTGIPLDVIAEGIAVLESPDPHSRTPDREGRRIERLDSHRPWGWTIVNHGKYRGMIDAETIRAQNRERQRRRRAKEDAGKHVESTADCHAPTVTKRDSHACHAVSRHTDTDTETPSTSKIEVRERSLPKVKSDEGFELFWAQYPRKSAKADARKAYDKHRPDAVLLGQMLGALRIACASDQWTRDDGRFVPYAATWLNGRRWEDAGTSATKPAWQNTAV